MKKSRISKHNHDAVHLEDYASLLKSLSDTSTERVALAAFLEGKNADQQMSALKQLLGNLKSSSIVLEDDLSDIIKALIDTFWNCPVKNPLKKAIKGALQKFPSEYHDKIRVSLSVSVCKHLSEKENNVPKDNIDNIASLLENFPLGEAAVSHCKLVVVSYLANALSLFCTAVSNSSCTVDSVEKINRCLVTLQVASRLLTKSSCPLSNEEQQALKLMYTTAWEILMSECFSLDSRSTAALLVISIIKTCWPADISRLTANVLSIMCDGTSMCSPDDSSQWCLNTGEEAHPFSACSVLSFCCGVLAMLQETDLMQPVPEIAPEGILLNCVVPVIFQTIPATADASTKLIGSRTLVQLSSKMCQVGMNYPMSLEMKANLGGKSTVCDQLIQYAYMHWEDSVDVVRHQAKTVFTNVIQCHTLVSEETPDDSYFLHSLLEKIMNMSWHMKGKYAGLSALSVFLSAIKILEYCPQLPVALIETGKEQSLLCHVCEIYMKLSMKNREEMKDTTSLNIWLEKWLHPVIQTLCSGTAVQKQLAMEYLIPSFLKSFPDILNNMLQDLASRTTGSGVMGAIIVCLKRAKTLGFVKSDTKNGSGGHGGGLWNNIVPVTLLQKALCHQDDQVRLDALGLLCENHKSTESVPNVDLLLVKFFLTFNLNSCSPTFRQYLIAYLKKLIARMKDGAQVLERSWLKEKNNDVFEKLEEYRNFLCWMVDFSFSSLHPSAAFPVRSCALGILSILMQIISLGCPSGSNPLVASLCSRFTPDKVQTLLESLTDTFEQNKVEAFTILQHIPLKFLNMEKKEKVRIYFETAVALAGSTKPQDCTTAAYLLKFLLQLPVLDEVLRDCTEEYGLQACFKELSCPAFGRLFMVLTILLQILQQQADTAKKNLLHAAATKPMYPALHCIRYLLQDLQMDKLKPDKWWMDLLSKIIIVSLDVAEVVSPVVSNSSPEGNVPLACLGPGLSVPVDTDTEESSITVNLMPEYLVVCCWRSIKEVSLLLGQLAETATVTDPTSQGPKCGLVSVEQILSIGTYFTKQLLESRHRGAFELAYAGFVKMSTMLWKSHIAVLHCLPVQWLDTIMSDIQSNNPDSKLCSTRRSAGVPFYIQALVTTEPSSEGRKCLKIMMEKLIRLALKTDSMSDSDNAPKVHSLNILRALFKDTRVGDDVLSYVADGIKAAILGFSSQTWAIRNSSTLLFSALIQRIFGVKRGKDDYSKKNCMTGRVFFNRYKSLYQFLLSQLDQATNSLDDQGVVHLHPGLYPVLMILGRLFPSVMETSGSGFNLSSFIPFLLRCAKSPVLKTRLMAARALQPLVYKDHMQETLLQILNQMPMGPHDRMSHNQIHGLLVQTQYLFQEVLNLPELTRTEIGSCTVPVLRKLVWLGSKENPCFLTRAEYIAAALTADKILAGSLCKNELFSLTRAELENCQVSQGLPGLVDFHLICADYILKSLPKHINECQRAVLICLNSSSYEVRKAGLKCLQILSFERNPGSEVSTIVGSGKIFERLVDMAFTSESNCDTLEMVLQIMIKHPCSQSFPWVTANNKRYYDKNVFEYLLKLSMEARQDEIGSAAFQLGSVALQKLLQTDPGCNSIRKWLRWLKEKCNSRESEVWHIACATVILENSPKILIDQESLLGSDVYSVWECLMQLLQAEDEDVRDVAAAAVLTLKQWLPEPAQGLCENQVHPSLAINLALAVLLRVHGQRLQLEMLQTLHGWILEDLEPDWRGENVQVRLFDKGEMNVYRDEGTFVRTVASYLSCYLSSALAECKPHSKGSINNIDGNQENSGSPCQAHQRLKSADQPDSMLSSCLFNSEADGTQGSFLDHIIHGALITDLKPKPLDETMVSFLLETYEKTMNTFDAYLNDLPSVTFSYPFLETQNFQTCQLQAFRYLAAVKVLSFIEKPGITATLNNNFQVIKGKIHNLFTEMKNTQMTMALAFL